MTVEARLRAAAQELRDAIEPEVSYFEGAEPARRRRRWGVAAAAAGIAAGAALVALLVPSSSPRRVPVGSGLTSCPSSFVLPFIPTHLPAGWTPVVRHRAHTLPGTNAIEVWGGLQHTRNSLYGVIEVWRGQGAAVVPTPISGTAITVLEGPALIGPISDGWSVLFTAGDPANRCNHWALVGHPGVTEPILLDVAQHLVPAG